MYYGHYVKQRKRIKTTRRETESVEEMTAKEYLSQIKHIKNRIAIMQEEIKTLKELSVSMGAMQQGEKVISSISGDKMADTICLIDEKMNTYASTIREFTLTRANVIISIQKVKNAEYAKLLYKKYCKLEHWEQIAIDMGIVFITHDLKLLKNFADKVIVMCRGRVQKDLLL